LHQKYGPTLLEHIVPAENPKFKKGDLVNVIDDVDLLQGLTLGIIISEPTLMFVYKSECIPSSNENYWVYDVVVGNQLIKELPEQIMKGFKNENEKNS
jgi:hypothetical protein